MSDWIMEKDDGVLLTLHIQPGAKRTEVAGLHGEALKIRLAAPPVDGKANACLVEFIATHLGLPRQQVRLISGQTSRTKRIAVAGAKVMAVRAALLKESA